MRVRRISSNLIFDVASSRRRTIPVFFLCGFPRLDKLAKRIDKLFIRSFTAIVTRPYLTILRATFMEKCYVESNGVAQSDALRRRLTRPKVFIKRTGEKLGPVNKCNI